MNKEKLVFKDFVKIVTPIKSKSKLNLISEKSLIDYKNIFQSDSFSFLNEKEKNINSEKILHKDFYKTNDLIFFNQITRLENETKLKLAVKDKFVDNNNSNNYEILFPENNSTYKVGEKIYFECCLVTENELDKECFDNLIWVSSLDGLIGIKNKFKTILSSGEHFISLILNENEQKIIKNTIKVNVIFNEENLPEIDKL